MGRHFESFKVYNYTPAYVLPDFLSTGVPVFTYIHRNQAAIDVNSQVYYSDPHPVETPPSAPVIKSLAVIDLCYYM